MALPQVNISGGGVRANLRAQSEIAAGTFWKYSSSENEVTTCGAGEEADGLALDVVEAGEILNSFARNYSRQTTGIYSDLVWSGASTPVLGAEYMSDSAGALVEYANAGDNRALGKILSYTTGGTTTYVKVSVYSK